MTPLAFSTLGTPQASVSEIAAIAVQHGFSGVELRAAAGEAIHVGLDATERRHLREVLSTAGVHVLSIASYVTVADPSLEDDEVIRDAIAHGRLAADVGAEFLRVFPGGPTPSDGGQADAGQVGEGQDDSAQADAGKADAAAIRRLQAIERGVVNMGVTVALETHDSHPRGADVARIVSSCPGVKAIWDILHTWRADETPAATAAALGDRLAYVQVKDVASPSDLTPLPPGAGILPLDEVANVLHAHGYRGWISWEYEKAWFPQTPPLADLGAEVVRRLRSVFGDR